MEYFPFLPPPPRPHCWSPHIFSLVPGQLSPANILSLVSQIITSPPHGHVTSLARLPNNIIMTQVWCSHWMNDEVLRRQLYCRHPPSKCVCMCVSWAVSTVVVSVHVEASTRLGRHGSTTADTTLTSPDRSLAQPRPTCTTRGWMMLD